MADERVLVPETVVEEVEDRVPPGGRRLPGRRELDDDARGVGERGRGDEDGRQARPGRRFCGGEEEDGEERGRLQEDLRRGL